MCLHLYLYVFAIVIVIVIVIAFVFVFVFVFVYVFVFVFVFAFLFAFVFFEVGISGRLHIGEQWLARRRVGQYAFGKRSSYSLLVFCFFLSQLFFCSYFVSFLSFCILAQLYFPCPVLQV